MNPKEKRGYCGLGELRLLLFAAVAMIPLALQAEGPAWWANQGVLNGNAPNDYSLGNQGQAKWMAVNAVNELNQDLSQFGGAGNALNALAVSLSATTARTNDYNALNLGELKALSQPFFDRLLALGYTGAPLTSGTYPWAVPGAGTPNDYAAGNIGQLKYLFSFDVTISSDGSGIPNWWENEFFPGQTVNPAGYSSSDGLTNMENYLDGVNPKVQLEVNVIVQ
jgi:hypothetical protein